MVYLFLAVVVAFGLQFGHRRTSIILCFATLLSACAVGGSSTMPPLRIPQEQVREVCWQPTNFDEGMAGEYFVIGRENDPPISDKQRPGFDWAVADGALIYKFSADAPIRNLRLLPLKYSEAWCSRIPKPTDEAVLRLLDPCTTAASTPDGSSVPKNMFGQTEGVPYRSSLFCNQPARMAPTAQETILLRAKNEAFQEAYDYAHKTAMALTQAEADTEAVTNKESGWLKRAFTSDPGTLEQIQQRLANTLNSIQAPPVFDDPELERIALLGFDAGFDNGKFEVKAKLLAIDAGVMLIEFAAMEVALGPLGGAKFLASAVSKGTKALTTASTRLGNIPIFLPIANGGGGAFIRVGTLVGSVSAKAHRYRLRKALEEKLGRVMATGESTHHIVALDHELAIKSREILAKFGIDIDDAVNGVFLPAFKKSPNPKGSIVHATLANKKVYYEKVEKALKQAKTPAQAVEQLRKIRKALLDGTFYDAVL